MLPGPGLWSPQTQVGVNHKGQMGAEVLIETKKLGMEFCLCKWPRVASDQMFRDP